MAANKHSEEPSHVVVVESPAKAGTIKKYLGSDYSVFASYGHVRDLLPKTGAVDPDNNFAMRYMLIEKNAQHVNTIRAAIKKADVLVLATDPDREGEAIAYHLWYLLDSEGLLQGKKVERVAFYEITKTAVQAAIHQGRDLSMDLINAQQARRALDYLVGFHLSPLLWKKVRPGLSAGRVQSPALCMIVEREQAIRAFVSTEYWTIEAALEKKKNFKAQLQEYQGEKLKQFSLSTAEQSQAIVENITQKAQGSLSVFKIDKKKKQRHPAAPFTTSTLQQESARKCGFGAQKTMRIAQQLYEGVDIGQGGTQGLITYMRTDSVNLAQTALEEIRAVIQQRFGPEECPPTPRFYKTKARNAQEAHEAIRPTTAALLPDQIKSFLSADQYKLYHLIWKRAVASQMRSAIEELQTVSLQMSAYPKEAVFRATGTTLVEPGFLRLYEEGLDDPLQGEDEQDAEAKLPLLKEGDVITVKKVTPVQHFTEPPPRFTEASLVKALEEHGIGRPSTYAAIVSTLVAREYVVLDKKRFIPTDVGEVIARFLSQYFTHYVDYGFTARMEDDLDAIARGEKMWIPVLNDFWSPFSQQVSMIAQTVQRKDVTQESLDEACPLCSQPLSVRLGKRGKFIGCTHYPECNYTRSMQEEAQEKEPPQTIEGRSCPLCSADLIIKKGRFGSFIGCSAYPGCKHIEPLQKPKETGVECPECHKGALIERKSRYGKFFYSCNQYPSCKYAVWNWPVPKACPQCAWPLTVIKTTKRKGTERVCAQKECDFAEAADPADDGGTPAPPANNASALSRRKKTADSEDER